MKLLFIDFKENLLTLHDRKKSWELKYTQTLSVEIMWYVNSLSTAYLYFHVKLHQMFRTFFTRWKGILPVYCFLNLNHYLFKLPPKFIGLNIKSSILGIWKQFFFTCNQWNPPFKQFTSFLWKIRHISKSQDKFHFFNV